jgi:hypothetical protein
MTWSDKPFSGTVSKNRRGRPRRHMDFHAMCTAFSAVNGPSPRNCANGHYALIADQHLQTVDEKLAWVWKSQVVRTELGRVIETHGKAAATDLVRQIARANPDNRVNSHAAAAGIRAGRLAAKRRS